MKLNLICILSVLFFSSHILSQENTYTISGHVFQDSIPASNAEVFIGSPQYQVFTNAKGEYQFKNLPAGKYIIHALRQQGLIETQLVELNSSVDEVNFYLKSSSIELEEVTICAFNKEEQIKFNPIKADVINTSQSLPKATNIQTLLNSSPGIKLRNSGALGARNEIIINGFSGRSIKLMRNGIPLDYLGSSFGITKIPVNSVERVEVYKGVLPTELGVDALGGAINMVDRQCHTSELQLSFERGSFNSNVATVNGFWKMSNNLSLGVYGFSNYSDNDYKVKNLPILDPSTGRNIYIEAPLFHNTFKQHFVEGYLNIDNLKWADLIQVRLTTFGIHQDVQNNLVNRSRPFGAVYRTEKTNVIPTVTYQKSLFDNKLYLKQFLAYSDIENSFVDTLKNVYYDWEGVPHPSISSSEVGRLNALPPGKVDVNSNNENFIYRGLFSYQFSSKQKVTANIINNYLINSFDDENRGYRSTSVNYNRFIAGVGYDALFFADRLNTIVQLKSLHFNTDGKTSAYSNASTTVSKSGLSFSFSAKYNFSSRWMIRGGYENTYRLPDQTEIFGDNSFILSNLDLSPEQSQNFNLGINLYESSKYSFEINGYYRNTTDLIKLKEINQFQGLYLNLENVKGYGVDLEGMVRPIANLKLTGNLTYNEFRFNGSMGEDAIDHHYKNARISNTPFYYGNLGADYIFKDVITKGSKLRTYWNYSYVHYYYLDYIEKQYEPNGFLGLYGKSKIVTDRIIPQQHLHTAGISFDTKAFKENRMSVGVEVRNLFNSDIYNNFKIQNPGRSIWVKIAYTIK